MSETTGITYDDAEPIEPVDGPDADGPGQDDLTTLLRRREHARPTRMTWVLLTVLVLTIGFIGGAFAGQKFGTPTSASGPASRFGALPGGFPPGAGFPGGASGGQGGLAGLTVGTVKLVDGQNLYITDTSGATIKVAVAKTATVTSQQAVALADLAAGTTVMVRGEAGADGTIAATSVSQGDLPGGLRAGGDAGTATAGGSAPATAAPSPAPSTP